MLVGLDIGSRWLHLVEGEFKKGKWQIRQVAKVKTPQGAVIDGEIQDTIGMIRAIKELWEANGIKTKKVRLTLYTSSLIQKNIKIPKVNKKEIPLLLDQELIASVQLSEPYTVGYESIEEATEDMWLVQAVAIPSKILQDYQSVLEKSGLSLVGVEVHSHATTKVAAQVGIKGCYLIADIGNRYMYLHLYEEGNHLFSKSTLINTEEYEHILGAVGRTGGNQSFEGLDLSPEVLEDDPLLSNTLGSYLSTLTDQLQNMVQFQLSRSGSLPVDGIYLIGGIAKLKGIDTYLGQYVDANIKCLEEEALVVDVVYTNALGTLIPGPLNLMQMYEAVQEQLVAKTPLQLTGMLIGGISLALIAGTWGKVKIETILLNNKIASLQRYLEDQYSSPEVQRLQMQKETYDRAISWEKQLDVFSNDKGSWYDLSFELLQQLKTHFPSETIIHSVAYSEGIIHLRGTVPHEQLLTVMVRSMRQSKTYEKVHYSGYNQEANGYTFEIVLELKGGDRDEVVQ